MSGAQSWSVKGIDPKVREAAREAAARQGVSLGEYLNQALTGQQPADAAPGANQQEPEAQDDRDEGSLSRTTDPMRLAQRIEAIERRTQLAVTGLDRAVSTIDRSVLGLASRIEDAEAAAQESADRISQALEQFRAAGETLGGKMVRFEQETVENRRSINSAKERLESQIAVAQEIARRADAAASYLTSEMENRDAAIVRTLEEARASAEQAARQAAEVSADAVAELRHLQEELSERLAETEVSTRRAVETAIAEVRAEAATQTRGAQEAVLGQVARLESEIASRAGSIDQIKSEHAALIARIERAEAGARESTAGLRQAAGAAIADLRNAQLTLAARLKQFEDAAGETGVIDVAEVRRQQQDIAERLAALEGGTDASPVAEALAAFERRLASVEAGGGAKVDEVDTAVRTLDLALQRLAERLVETESTANTAIRKLEETVSSLGARVERGDGASETQALRAMLEQRLDSMAQSVTQMVGAARSELAEQLQSALEGAAGEGLEGALADVNRRLAAAERRQAQTIEAISIEIRRMSETVDKRLRAVEARNDDAAASAVREELARMANALETRFDEIERREAEAFDRMGLEVGRLSERLEERVGAVESRSAQAIEHVGEQVARVAERFGQRQDLLARELGERMLDTEERAGARVAEAISSIMQRLAEVEEHSIEAVAPVQKAVSSLASKVEQLGGEQSGESIPTPQRRVDDFTMFGDLPEPQTSPMDAATPVRAAPLPPAPGERSLSFARAGDDPFGSESTAIGENRARPPFERSSEKAAGTPQPADAAAAAPPPPADDDPFWTPDEIDKTQVLDETGAPRAAAPLTPVPHQPALDALQHRRGKNDYLANARRAAQAQSLPKTREPAPAPKLSLRGSSRIVLWGSASLIAMLLAGGAWYYNSRQSTAAASRPEQPTATPAAASDAAAPAAPADPFAEAPVQGSATDAAPSADASTSQSGAATVAGPLAPRSVSLEGAAQAGDLTAQYELALQRISAGRAEEGITLLRRAADRGFPMAQYRLAKLYERGDGVQADLTIARQWTERAAAAGNRRAMHDLGVYFARGEGAPLDDAAAYRWFRQAAELGVADSQYNLGVLYQQGRGVTASSPEALFWFMVAARQGDRDAAARSAALEAQLSAAQVEQARARAQAFRPHAASAVANGDFGPRPWTRAAAQR